MNTRLLLPRLRDSLEPSISATTRPHMWVPLRRKSGGGVRPKKKIYHRVHELDKAMDLRKKPSLILKLKCIIQSQKTQSLLLRDLEKEVGFVQKWNFMALIEKYPSIFRVCGGNGNKTPPFVRLTEKAQIIAQEESEAMVSMEPILVNNLRKLLMLSVNCKVPLETIKLIGPEMGLPIDFERSLIPKYPEFFSIKCSKNGKVCVFLENWDSSLAVTAREEKLASQGIVASNGNPRRVRISRDGNYPGPHSFSIDFPAGFRPNTSFLEQFEKWQKLDFPSPYLSAKRFEIADPRARKRVVGVIHELFSLTMERRLTSAQVEAFHSEYYLPSKLILCLIKHHGIFYITNKGERSSVFLKEAYDGSSLIEKCPLLMFNDKFVGLCSGRVEISSRKGIC